VLERFMRAIVPHQEYVTASFQKDSDIPQLEGASAGGTRRLEEGPGDLLASHRRRQKNPKIRASSSPRVLELGLAYEYRATTTARRHRAEGLRAVERQRHAARADNIKRLQDEAKRVSEQTAAPVVGGAK